jgi:membrane protein DedA with SNARE-associated domain/rhodanese-related sulfurtransferase
MNEASEFLIRHGLPLLFAAVLVEQMGVPIPAPPTLLAVGALAAEGKFNLFLGILVTAAACVIADTSWFYLGRYRGNRVLNFLCRISLEPDSCVRRTQNVFTRYGLRGIAIAKFLPGMSIVAPPLAGMSGISIARFLLADGIGSLLYGSAFLLLGFVFSKQIRQIAAALESIGGSALTLIAVAVGSWIAFKYWQRRRLLRELRMARITVSELRRKQQDGEIVLVLDLRSSSALEQDPSRIPGAVHISLEDIQQRNHDFPRDREIIVYCSCPNEATAARVALLLQRSGFTRVRPLLGGIDAWREQDYPLEPLKPVVAGILPATQSETDTAESDSRKATTTTEKQEPTP